MPILGNNVAGGASLSLTPSDLFGHFDPADFAAHGSTIPAAAWTQGVARVAGPPIGQPNANMQLGLYDTSPNPAIPATWIPVSTSNVVVINTAMPPQWVIFPWVASVAAGTYVLAVLSNSAGAFTGSIHYTVKANGPDLRTFIVPGVFPNPLGAPVGGTRDWNLYIEWTQVFESTHTAVCCCENDCE